MAKYKTVIDALSDNDLAAAKDLLLAEVKKEVGERKSWDSPYYTADKKIQKSIKLNYDNDKLISFFGLENLRDRYFLTDSDGKLVEDIQTFFARVATGLCRGEKEFAQKLYNVMSKCWLMPATPVLTNTGNKRGLPISCFLNTVPDTLEGIFDIYRENAFLSKYAGGIGTDWSQLRGHNAPLKAVGLKSSGVIPFLKIMDSETIAISRNGLRRGAAAAYLRIDHPDIEEFLEMRKPTGGDINRKCLNLNHGVVITDEFMKAVEEGTTYKLIDPHYKTVSQELDAKEMWRKILKIRAETGEPYIIFIDTINKARPEHHKKLGLEIRQSNLCCEITLPTTEDRTAVCCLASLNLEKYDEWKDQIEEITYLGVKALDNNLESFIEMADPVEFKKAINSVKHERSIGLGVMGYHGYLMKRGIPFETISARAINKEIFENINKHAMDASEKLGKERGLPLDGGTRRNTYVMAIAPTASISYVCNEATPSVEPISGNAYLQKTLAGSFLVKNKYLEQLLETKGKNTTEVWKDIIAAKGSVQHMDILTNEEKKVFRTGYEMNMREIVEQAAQRQPFIDQAVSLNLFFSTPISGKYLNEAHFLAWKLGVKTLYYVRSSSAIQAENIERGATQVAPVRDLANEECAVCQ
ncbi:MAG: ribonucleoside-diphosphate reductase subunit alpha [bacterium]